MKRPRPYRVGDKVRILKPLFVQRVGYPLTASMLDEEFSGHPKLHEAMTLLGLDTKSHKAKKDFLLGVRKAAVRTRHFGGNERTIHYCEYDSGELEGVVTEVIKKRLVKTGKYFPPSGGHVTHSGEYDWEPGGLDNCKTHVLLWTRHGEIEACNVELVKE